MLATYVDFLWIAFRGCAANLISIWEQIFPSYVNGDACQEACRDHENAMGYSSTCEKYSKVVHGEHISCEPQRRSPMDPPKKSD